MKYFFVFLVFQITCTNIVVAQEADNEVAFAVIDKVPIYKGCNKKWSNSALKKCMSEKVVKHVVKHFNINVANGLGFPDGKVKINVIFKVNNKGDVTGIKASGPHSKLEEEAIRVIKLLPKFKPGMQDGKAVTVPYALPLIFNIDNSKYKKNKQ